MTKEIEQKKEYLTPKMDVIEMRDDTALLQGSCVDGNDCDITTIFKKD